MSDPPRVRPVSLPERVVTTALVPVLMLLGERIPLSNIDAAALGRTRVEISPLAVGLGPFITAYGLVELTALIVPRWRRWRHDAQGRARLERWSAVLAIGLALVQAWSIAESLRAAEIVTTPGWEPLAVHTATLTGGACAMALAARWATRRGLVNGYVLWWTLPVVIDLFRGAAFRQAAIRGGLQDVAFLAVVLGVVVVATVLAVAGGDVVAAAVRVDDSAYRGGQTDAPRPWFPIPVSSLQPITFAGAVLMFPAVLANLKVPGMADLQAVLQRGDVTFEAAYLALIAFAALVAASLLYRPDEVSAFMRRLGSVSDETAREGTVSALRRAMLPTMAYLLVLVLASRAAHSKASAVPAMVTIALATGAVVDLLRSTVAHVRARDLVCVTQLHDAYAVAALRAALGAEGIDARPRGMAVLSLLQAFGPYAPVELYVRAGDAERASALLRHWAAGEAKPAASPASVPGAQPVAWSPRTRALVLAGLGGVVLAVRFTPRAGEGPPPKRAEIALVRVDDAVDPLRGAREDDAPDGVFVYAMVAPLGANHRENRSFARITLRPGESVQAAWARLLPWLQGFPLPAGDRWAWEPSTEVDDDTGDAPGTPTRFRVVGVQTLVLTGDPVATTADVESADVGMDEESWRPYVLVTLTSAASERFYGMTTEWVERRMAIVIDDHVDSAPVIRSPIRGGRLTITMGAGEPDKQLADARLLAASLR